MIKSYKYKLKPTIKQQTQLNQFFGCARFVYNKKKISKNVKLNIKGITLEFDVSILRNVLEVFND